ncbi:DNA polymerase IV (DinB-like DNA polymerase) [Halarchaeum rubridurum]|uniref:DNA polymerase IV n=1 Tax=Halarchaeum rubridurum TaxID=489911 RepID=A0A830FVL6_9EURY|nr:DNA polymerase IV [Halarchaeum rubridurum]MBP1953237.1 DNA polymerase IV (DinB-like DNA polymerase) [Halarchaeum rubridurum]GGM66835.1 DNA polymerase IV [Halarchaeum rubridurum]
MTAGGRLPGAPDPTERIVLHVDMDCFYASCERKREPALRGEPVVVGMGYEAGETVGAVATASYEARAHGVESAQAISTALERLPRRADDPDGPSAHYRPVDLDYYEDVAADVKTILHDLADTVREVSIDEAYLDVTDRTAWDVAAGFARHVKQRIAREAGVPASVGVAPDMSTAKIASDHDKPDGLVVVPPDEVESFLAPIDVADVHGVGPVRARELREMGIETAGDLADADPYALIERFGERGRDLHERALGRDDRPVEPRDDPKSLSRESAFDGPVGDHERVREQALTLADAVADRARRKDALYRTIGVKVVTPPYDVNTRARSLPGPVDDPALVRDVAADLLAEFADASVRKVGVRVSNLSFAAGEQARLGGFGDEHAPEETSATADGEAVDATDATDATSGDGQASLGDF